MRLWLLIFVVILGILVQSRIKADRDVEIMNTLIRQTARWSAAAKQDESPIIALLHANYGAGYLWALKDIYTDQDIMEKTGINVIEFKKKIIDIQDGATRKVSAVCPKFIGDLDKYLLKLGGDV